MPDTTLPSPRKRGRPELENGKSGSSGLGEARSLSLLKAMRAFRDGDFTIRLPDDWDGLAGQIAEAFNNALSHEERIASEIHRLSVTVGKEGRLKQRMTVVFVTHSISEAVFLSQRVVMMAARPGRITDEVLIDEPYPRTREFLVTPRFGAYAKRLQDSLHRAAGGEAALTDALRRSR